MAIGDIDVLKWKKERYHRTYVSTSSDLVNKCSTGSSYIEELERDQQNKEILINKLNDQNKEILEALIEADEIICELCVIINPHHKRCTKCDDRKNRMNLIEKITKRQQRKYGNKRCQN